MNKGPDQPHDLPKPDSEESERLSNKYDFKEDEDESLDYTKIGRPLSEEEKSARIFTSYTGEGFSRRGVKELHDKLDLEWSVNTTRSGPGGALRIHGDNSDSTEKAVKEWARKKAEQLQITYISYASLCADAKLLEQYRKEQEFRKQHFLLIEANLRTVEGLPWLHDVDLSGATGVVMFTEFTRANPNAWRIMPSIIDDRSRHILVVATGYMPALDEDAGGLTWTKGNSAHTRLGGRMSVFYFDANMP